MILLYVWEVNAHSLFGHLNNGLFKYLIILSLSVIVTTSTPAISNNSVNGLCCGHVLTLC